MSRRPPIARRSRRRAAATSPSRRPSSSDREAPVSGESIWLGRGTKDVSLQLRMANRHGLIAGATGTGKTVSLQVLTEGFSRSGVPVFLADVKGDLGGLSQVGGEHPKARERAAALAIAD